ncbi:MAG: hypothetical protein V1672_01720 [Candidatus Diapherotrites archaeon]
MRRKHEWIRQRKKRGEGFSEEDSPEETTEFAEEQAEEATGEPIEEAAEEKIGIEPLQEQEVVLRPLKISSQKRSFITFRKRRKIGDGMLEKEIKEQKAKAKKAMKKLINELPEEQRKAFLEELLEEYE